MAKLTQCEKILKAMLENPDKERWYASDFQGGKYFVGYEASARMSDLLRLYPFLFNIEQDGRFRTMGINWKNNKKVIKALKKELEIR